MQIITLNRPKAYNALNLKLGDDLLQALIDCDENDAVRAVMITGNGPAFCSGGDIRQMQEKADESGKANAFLKQLTVRLHASVSTLVRMKKPVITAVNGPAAGAGLSLALAGDMVVASADAKFTVAYTAIGLAPDGSSTHFLPRLVGTKRAFELMAMNRTLSASDAQSMGIINTVLPADSFATDAEAIAQKLAGGPTQALWKVKELLAASVDSSLETSMEFERRAIADCGKTSDFIEGTNAFIEKRNRRFHRPVVNRTFSTGRLWRSAGTA